MAFTRVGDLLLKHRRRFDDSQVVIDSVTILAAWHSIIDELGYGVKFERTKAMAFRNGNLTIQAASSAVASEVKMAEHKIVACYEKRFKSGVVERLVIKRN